MIHGDDEVKIKEGITLHSKHDWMWWSHQYYVIQERRGSAMLLSNECIVIKITLGYLFNQLISFL